MTPKIGELVRLSERSRACFPVLQEQRFSKEPHLGVIIELKRCPDDRDFWCIVEWLQIGYEAWPAKTFHYAHELEIASEIK